MPERDQNAAPTLLDVVFGMPELGGRQEHAQNVYHERFKMNVKPSDYHVGVGTFAGNLSPGVVRVRGVHVQCAHAHTRTAYTHTFTCTQGMRSHSPTSRASFAVLA